MRPIVAGGATAAGIADCDGWVECVGELNDPFVGVNGMFVVTSGSAVCGTDVRTFVGSTDALPDNECACRVTRGRDSGHAEGTADAAAAGAAGEKMGAARAAGIDAGADTEGAADERVGKSVEES